ncbi:hypothetical protein [Streptomyces sp. AV19]|uniref:hypothetical protein n=1 Tax=Streptomyces sp. AV19 TaxID=2793068 RepID=UPI0024138CFB|nr:hypothetical protein [Streptomyces sp. AV19]MDG4531700.1 hypothetical protein [Streptomyces sp. AV19]
MTTLQPLPPPPPFPPQQRRRRAPFVVLGIALALLQAYGSKGLFSASSSAIGSRQGSVLAGTSAPWQSRS